MSPESTSETYGQGGKGKSGAAGNPAVEELVNLFRQASVQMRQAPVVPELEGPAKDAAEKFEEIKVALATPRTPISS